MVANITTQTFRHRSFFNGGGERGGIGGGGSGEGEVGEMVEW